MDYKALWTNLEGWLGYLRANGVSVVPPMAVLDKMNDIYNLQDKDDQLEVQAQIITQLKLGRN